MLSKFLCSRRCTPSFECALEDRIGSLYAPLGLKQFEIVHGAQLNDALPLTDHDAAHHRGFLAEQDRIVVTLQTCGVFDRFDGRALPKVGLTGPGLRLRAASKLT